MGTRRLERRPSKEGVSPEGIEGKGEKRASLELGEAQEDTGVFPGLLENVGVAGRVGLLPPRGLEGEELTEGEGILALEEDEEGRRWNLGEERTGLVLEKGRPSLGRSSSSSPGTGTRPPLLPRGGRV